MASSASIFCSLTAVTVSPVTRIVPFSIILPGVIILALTIFNRWGVKVFEKEHYNNTDRVFRGVSEGRLTLTKSDELPGGTYFYVLSYKDKELNIREKSGYLYINK
jgi:hypothetical protein